MCKLLKVSPNSYYVWLKTKDMKSTKTSCLKAQIRDVFFENNQIYGAPKIKIELEKRGCFYSVQWISKLMKQMNLRSKTIKKFVTTTDSKHHYKINDNLLNRNFSVNQTSKVWVSDITYIKVADKWNYLTTIIDLADRSVVASCLSDRMTAEQTTIKAWRIAVQHRCITQPFIFHSDRGVQYACTKFRNILNQNPNVRQSMSRKGDCWDNAVAESFFKSIKYEYINHMKFKTKQQAEDGINQYVTWYNTKRIHAAIGYKTPLEKYAQINNIFYQNVA